MRQLITRVSLFDQRAVLAPQLRQLVDELALLGSSRADANVELTSQGVNQRARLGSLDQLKGTLDVAALVDEVDRGLVQVHLVGQKGRAVLGEDAPLDVLEAADALEKGV